MEVQIRAWQEAELTALLHRAYKRHADQGLHYVATDQDEAVTRNRLAKGHCFVGVRELRMIATITLYPPNPASACLYYRQPNVWYFGQFAVEPDFQRQGLGSRLMAHVEEFALHHGAREIALDTSEQSLELIEYYQKRGYRIVDSVQWSATNYRSLVLAKILRQLQ